MPDPVPDASLWLVGDATAAGAVGDHSDRVPTVRLDRPGWEVALDGLPTDGVVGVAVTGDTDPAALGGALAGLTGAEQIELLVVRPAPEVSRTLGAALGWAGLGTGSVRTLTLPDGEALHASLHRGDGQEGGALTVALLAGLAVPERRAERIGTGWRVAVVGADAWSWLGSWVRSLPVRRSALGALDDTFEHLDVVVASPAEDWDDEGLAALLDEARALGAATVAVAPADSAWAAAAAVHLAPERDVRPVDLQRVNPQGWRRRTGDTLALVPTQPPHDLGGALAAAREQVEGRRLRLLGAVESPDPAVPAQPAEGPALLQVLRNVRGVVDHPLLHPDAAAQASWLATLALAAIPVVCLELPDQTAQLLGERLAGVLRGTRVADLDDADERERRTVLARRAAWLAHSTGARWRQLAPDLGLTPPRRTTFSMILATNRPDFLDHVVQQIDRQTWDDTELVAALHGERFPTDAAERITDGTRFPTTILRVPDHESLGGVLNRAADAASGDVLTKFDDDDWYSPDHIVDLALALEHSGAHIVGKAAEFVYLSGTDATIRRFVEGAETGSRSLAGGTLTFRRDVLRDVGGFLRVGLREDGALIDDVLAAGGRVHRTHGFGYVLHRHGSHAWEAEDAYFLDQAEARRDGLDHDWTLT